MTDNPHDPPPGELARPPGVYRCKVPGCQRAEHPETEDHDIRGAARPPRTPVQLTFNPEGAGVGKLIVAGHDVSAVVAAVTVEVVPPRTHVTVELTDEAIDASVVADHVEVALASALLLQELGWTPPPGATS